MGVVFAQALPLTDASALRAEAATCRAEAAETIRIGWLGMQSRRARDRRMRIPAIRDRGIRATIRTASRDAGGDLPPCVSCTRRPCRSSVLPQPRQRLRSSTITFLQPGRYASLLRCRVLRRSARRWPQERRPAVAVWAESSKDGLAPSCRGWRFSVVVALSLAVGAWHATRARAVPGWRAAPLVLAFGVAVWCAGRLAGRSGRDEEHVEKISCRSVMVPLYQGA